MLRKKINPKKKTNKAYKKRFRITKNKKVIRRHCGMNHLLSGKSSKNRRFLKSKENVEIAIRDKIIAKIES